MERRWAVQESERVAVGVCSAGVWERKRNDRRGFVGGSYAGEWGLLNVSPLSNVGELSGLERHNPSQDTEDDRCDEHTQAADAGRHRTAHRRRLRQRNSRDDDDGAAIRRRARERVHRARAEGRRPCDRAHVYSVRSEAEDQRGGGGGSTGGRSAGACVRGA